jgi:hypothetical protein
MPSSRRRSKLVLLGFVVIGTIGLTYIRAYHTVPLQLGRAYFIAAVCQPSMIAFICGWYRFGLGTVVTASLIPPVVGVVMFRVLVPYPGSYGLEQVFDEVVIISVASLIILTISTGIYAFGRKARTVVGPAVSHIPKKQK